MRGPSPPSRAADLDGVHAPRGRRHAARRSYVPAREMQAIELLQRLFFDSTLGPCPTDTEHFRGDVVPKRPCPIDSGRCASASVAPSAAHRVCSSFFSGR